MTLDDKTRDEKLQYNIDKETAKILRSSSWKIDKYVYFTGEEILPFDQRRVIEQAKFTYYPLGKALQKQTKTIEGQEKNQIKAIENHGKELVESNALVKKMIMIIKSNYFWRKKKWNCCWKK